MISIFTPKINVTQLKLVQLLLGFGAKIRTEIKHHFFECDPFFGLADLYGKRCGCGGDFKEYKVYNRFVIFHFFIKGDEETPGRTESVILEMAIMRVQCQHCKQTHAILPGFLIPYTIPAVQSLALKQLTEICDLYEDSGEPIDIQDFLPGEVVITEEELKELYATSGFDASKLNAESAVKAMNLNLRNKTEALCAFNMDFDRCESAVRILNNSKPVAAQKFVRNDGTEIIGLFKESSVFVEKRGYQPSFHERWDTCKTREIEYSNLQNETRLNFIDNTAVYTSSSICYALLTICEKYYAFALTYFESNQRLPLMDEGNKHIPWEQDLCVMEFRVC
jgi:hypothetical protein